VKASIGKYLAKRRVPAGAYKDSQYRTVFFFMSGAGKGEKKYQHYIRVFTNATELLKSYFVRSATVSSRCSVWHLTWTMLEAFSPIRRRNLKKGLCRELRVCVACVICSLAKIPLP